MTDVVVGAGSIAQAIARPLSAGKHVVRPTSTLGNAETRAS